MMNIEANNYLLNDIDNSIISIHRMLCSYIGREQVFYNKIFSTINKYGLSLSCQGHTVPEELKKTFPKTYYAKYNKEAYNLLKYDFNRGEKQDAILLYLLLIYGFNRMIRFNKKGEFNTPVGDVDFNQNVRKALDNYFNILAKKKVEWSNKDFRQFLQNVDYKKDDFIYSDPPYLIAFSEYNKLWNIDTERALLTILDELNNKGIRFAISNITHYKNKVNEIFIDWAAKYTSYPIKSNYISFNDNTIKQFNEVLVVNY